MSLLDAKDAARVAEAIAAVEARTDGELVTVLAPRSDDYRYIPLLWAACTALVVPWLLLSMPFWLETQDILLAQLAVFGVVATVLRVPALLHRSIPRAVREWRASSLARRQFIEQNLHHTEGETGLLIFVSEAEHYVEILVDRGIARHVSDEVFQKLVDGFTASVRAGQVAEGFITCIEACGALLEQHVPKTHDRDELPNHLVILGQGG